MSRVVIWILSLLPREGLSVVVWFCGRTGAEGGGIGTQGREREDSRAVERWEGTLGEGGKGVGRCEEEGTADAVVGVDF